MHYRISSNTISPHTISFHIVSFHTKPHAGLPVLLLVVCLMFGALVWFDQRPGQAQCEPPPAAKTAGQVQSYVYSLCQSIKGQV